MSDGKLARMANQIAVFFSAYPEADAIAGVRDHLHAFWTPKMIDALQVLAAEEEGEALHPLVRKAMGPAPDGDDPAARTVEGPNQLGSLASDAG